MAQQPDYIYWPFGILSLLFAGLGIYGIITAGIMPLYDSIKKSSWHKAECAITESQSQIIEVKNETLGIDEKIYQPRITYAYTWKGRQYSSTKPAESWETFETLAEVNAYLRDFSIGDVNFCLVDPSRPDKNSFGASAFRWQDMAILLTLCIWTLGWALAAVMSLSGYKF